MPKRIYLQIQQAKPIEQMPHVFGSAARCVACHSAGVTSCSLHSMKPVYTAWNPSAYPHFACHISEAMHRYAYTKQGARPSGAGLPLGSLAEQKTHAIEYRA
jgi:hypothetical protein